MPYWAVMLSGVNGEMINMVSRMDEYKVAYPRSQIYGGDGYGGAMTLELPLLTNSRDLAPGDLLVMPSDGGIREIFCDEFPAISSEMA